MPKFDPDRTEELLAHLNTKIDLLTNVVAFFAIEMSGDRSTTERARLLKMAGMDNQTIANILNTSPATVRTLTSNLRGRVPRSLPHLQGAGVATTAFAFFQIPTHKRPQCCGFPKSRRLCEAWALRPPPTPHRGACGLGGR